MQYIINNLNDKRTLRHPLVSKHLNINKSLTPLTIEKVKELNVSQSHKY